MKRTIGTYSNCSNCKNKITECCTNFNNIDDPLMTKEEMQMIEKKTGLKSIGIKATKNLYKIRTNDKGHCIFFNNNKCKIYKYRPTDCRLFPFDLKLKDNKKYLIIYKKPCENFAVDQSFISDNINNIELLVGDLKKYIKEYNDENCFDKLKDKEYIIIKEID